MRKFYVLFLACFFVSTVSAPRKGIPLAPKKHPKEPSCCERLCGKKKTAKKSTPVILVSPSGRSGGLAEGLRDVMPQFNPEDLDPGREVSPVRQFKPRVQPSRLAPMAHRPIPPLGDDESSTDAKPVVSRRRSYDGDPFPVSPVSTQDIFVQAEPEAKPARDQQKPRMSPQEAHAARTKMTRDHELSQRRRKASGKSGEVLFSPSQRNDSVSSADKGVHSVDWEVEELAE